jgi:N6-L-threonylcarbamoyladenine synthase
LQQTGVSSLVVAGGVGANRALRDGLRMMAAELGAGVFYPRLEFCTDNGAMIAYAGACRLLAGQQQDLDLTVSPRWSLEELAPV